MMVTPLAEDEEEVLGSWKYPNVINQRIQVDKMTSTSFLRSSCVYGVTPDFFYDESNRALYPPAEEALPLPRYRAILAALSGNPFTKEGGSDQWMAPFTPDRDISYAYELAQRLSADIGFVDGTTIASLDDDLIRLRSKTVDDIGLTHVRNPKKGYGPVQHGVVSLVTGLLLGGHVAANGESKVDITRSSENARAPLLEAELIVKTLGDLKPLCRDLGLRVSGNKATLIGRLLQNDAGEALPGRNIRRDSRYAVDSALLSTWFMAPFSTPSTKIGTANEVNIASHITLFLDIHTHDHIEELREYGLLCKSNMPVAAFSPDHIAAIVSVRCGRFNAVMEHKNRATARTVQQEQAAAKAYVTRFFMIRGLCTSYKVYQKHKQNLPSFAAFCREAAVVLSKKAGSLRPLSDARDKENRSGPPTLELSFAYNKRNHFE
ncbi:uncharacterized protein PITG_21091 [Phytophthora infestans T30-4]|uniref:SAP domain-containing protein n=1 Tax=Phytophthora infestans (strain T30-4) TaxID=403677 RepID=D0P3K6_PHYIT|nr:uncharacterized protein PITG_21091 [Phytophthora infestans T30-4]EEY60053.1 conserved hypothetical protein [Phytophthora infestans T30-4]|eukprot:XP_002895116.1 conserved hypothetical protein [Phytophthora infestans T30-4]